MCLFDRTANTRLVLLRIVVRFTDVASGIERGMKHLGPLINERLEQEARYGEDWLDKPVSCYYS